MVEVEAIDPAGMAGIVIGDIEPAAGRAGGHTPDIMDVRDRPDGLDQPVPPIDVIDQDRAAVLCSLADRVEGALRLTDGRIDRCQQERRSGSEQKFAAR